MKNFRFHAIAGFCLLAVACKTMSGPTNSSLIRTDETYSALANTCKQFVPDDIADELIASICSCIETDRAALGAEFVTETCAEKGLERHVAHMRSLLTSESIEGFTTDEGVSESPEDRECAAQLTEFYLENYLSDMQRQCQDSRVTYAEFRSHILLPQPTSENQCWVMTQMTKDACVLARPCRNSGPSDPAFLPLSSESLERAAQVGMVPEDEYVTICHQELHDIHRLKDPANENLNHNLAFASLLTFGRSAKNISFGPANCHGTAQALIGGVLDGFTATKIAYHSPTVRNDCGAEAEREFAKAAAKSGASLPLSRDLPVERGGYLINMNHDESCEVNECGDVSFSISSCDSSGLVANIFHQGMCVKCWDQLLQKAGWMPLDRNATWQDLKPGCILTASDHSITHLYASNGMCYYYESTTPYGPPQLRVDSCNHVYQNFGRRWCSQVPEVFELRY